MTHANMGWQGLRQNNYSKAQEHFLEALRIEPGHEYARRGLVEALKSRNIFYRPILNYLNFMSTLSSRAQWGIIIGAVLLNKIVGKSLMANESTRGLGIAVYALYLTFVLTSWAGPMLFNVMLLFHPLGRHALSPREKIASSICASLIISAVLTLVYTLIGKAPQMYFWAGLLPFLCIPIANAFSLARESKRQLGYIIAGVFCLLATIGYSLDLIAESGGLFFSICVFGLVAYSWAGNLVLRD